MSTRTQFPLLPERFKPDYVYNHAKRKFDSRNIPIVHPSEFRVPNPKVSRASLKTGVIDDEEQGRFTAACGKWHQFVHMTDRNGHTPNIIKVDVTLEELANRPRTDENFDIATDRTRRILEELKGGSMKAIEESCIIVDKNQKPLLYLFAHGSGRLGRQVNHGIPKKVMDEFQIHFQRLAAKFPPVLARDKRHREIPWMEYIKDLTEEEEDYEDQSDSDEDQELKRQQQETIWLSNRIGIDDETDSVSDGDLENSPNQRPSNPFSDEVYDSGTVRAEPRGVYHLLHAWHPQGQHLKSNLLPSKNTWGGSSTRKIAVESFMTRLKTVHTLMAKLFETANPIQYAEYHKVFQALKSKLPDSKTGAWIGSALLWKTLVGLHQDVSDGEHQWCGTVNGGEYESDAGLGELCPMILPDLNLAIAYRPGNALIFRSGPLYHAVADWKPLKQLVNASLTPGRIAVVFFTPALTRLVYDQRKDGTNPHGALQSGQAFREGYENTNVYETPGDSF